MAEEIWDVMPGRPKNVMSVELAIQRELAYRKTLSEVYGGSIDGLKPLELTSVNPNPCPSKKRPAEPKSSSQDSQPKPSPTDQSPSSYRLRFSNANPSAERWSVHVSGAKRKEPSRSGVKYCREEHVYSNSSNGTLENETGTKYLFCEICQVHCSGEFNMKQHLDGQKHRAKLVLAVAEDEGREIGGEMENKPWKCQVCKIYCLNEESLKLHLLGKKHITSLHLY